MTLERKLELAMWLCEHNYNISLTGSMMLYLRWIQEKDHNIENFYLGREPQDLDFIVNVEEEYEDGDFVLPPFITNEEMVDSNFTGYPVLKRFYCEDVKVEFIEAPHYRFTEERIPHKFDESKFSVKSFLRDFQMHRSGQKDIRLALITDLVAAKKQYVEDDDNASYIDKTVKDLESLNPIIEECYLDDYKVILESYLKHNWYYAKRENDAGRDLSEKLIETNLTNNSNPKWMEYLKNSSTDYLHWLEYIKKIDHNYVYYFRTWYRKEKDSFYDSRGYTYELRKVIEKLLYEFEIPFELNQI